MEVTGNGDSSLIYSIKTLQIIRKYLKANLSGEAEKLIRYFSVTNENYQAAWKTLYDRYENKRLLVATLIKNFLAQPTSNSESTANVLKVLYDTTKECLLDLETLDVPTRDWDPILLHLLIKRLVKTTHMFCEQSLKNLRELQTIDGFLRFLEKRFQSLEA